MRIHYISALFMIDLTAEELKQYFSDDIFKRISETADELGLECYVVGGYVRDIFLNRPSKDIDVVVALNDPSAMGAMAALDAEHMLSDVLVYGADGSPEAKTMIYKNRMMATAAQSPRITGKKTVEMLYKILAGKPVESQYIVPVRLITRDNVEDYSLSGWQ